MIQIGGFFAKQDKPFSFGYQAAMTEVFFGKYKQLYYDDVMGVNPYMGIPIEEYAVE